MSDTEQTYTYTLILGCESPYAGGDTDDTLSLGDYGYSDQEWDELTERQQERYLDEWSEGNFWNNGYGYHGKVERG